MANWYMLLTTGGADPLDPIMYVGPLPNRPACPGNRRICAIYADDNGSGYPIITISLEEDMVRALQFSSDQTTVVLGD